MENYPEGITGVAYNYFRDYDPTLGRYLESDPIGLGGGLNTYGYALSDPFGYSDKWGLIPNCFIVDEQVKWKIKSWDDKDVWKLYDIGTGFRGSSVGGSLPNHRAPSPPLGVKLVVDLWLVEHILTITTQTTKTEKWEYTTWECLDRPDLPCADHDPHVSRITIPKLLESDIQIDTDYSFDTVTKRKLGDTTISIGSPPFGRRR